MSLHTSRRNIEYPNPDRSDRSDVAYWVKQATDALDLDVIYNNGTDAARLAAAHQSGGGRFWWTTDTHLMWYDDGATWRIVTAGALQSVVTVTATGTYTTGPNTNKILAKVIGGGGGGGGSQNPSGFGGNGGNAGAFAQKLIAVAPSTGYAAVVGAGGVGGSGPGVDGGAGGDSSLTIGGTVITAHGANANSSTPATATGGDINIPGDTKALGGGNGGNVSTGGGSPYGHSGVGGLNGAQCDAIGYGSGGGGGGSTHGGGAGGPGIIVIEEYS